MERPTVLLAAVWLLASLGPIVLIVPPGGPPAPLEVGPSLVAPFGGSPGPAPTDAVVSVGMSASTSRASPKDVVVFTVFVNNTGDQAAPRLWVNDTLGPSFTYVSDTAGLSGSTTPWPRFTFVGLGPGTYSFQVQARVKVGVTPGSVDGNAVSLVYTNAAGSLRTGNPAQASVVLGLATKALHLAPGISLTQRLTPAAPGPSSTQVDFPLPKADPPLPVEFDLDPALARSFRVLDLTAILFLDSKNGDARRIDVNLSVLDWNGVSLVSVAYFEGSVTTNAFRDFQRFTFPFGSVDYTFPAGHQIRLSVAVLATSEDDALLATNAVNADSQLLLVTSTYVAVDRVDLRDASGPASIWTSLDALVVRANVSDPFGSADIAEARVNLTSPSGRVVLGYAGMSLVQTDPGNPSAWKLFEARVDPPLENGTYLVEVVGLEGNGVLDVAEGTALVRSPNVSLAKIASVVQAKTGARFTYTIWFNNTGTGPAGRVWINDSLPSGLLYRGGPPSNESLRTGAYNWTQGNVGPGAHWISFDVQVQGSSGAAYLRNWAFLNVTDEKGHRWPGRFAFVDVVVNGPAILLSLSSSPASRVHGNETVVYTITMSNSGDPALTVWLNDTLPAGLSYVGDTAGLLGGTRTFVGNEVHFVFSNMPGGTVWTFTLTAVAAPLLPRNATLVSVLTLNSTSTNGVLMPPRSTSLSLLASAPWLTAGTIQLAEATAAPGQRIAATVNLSNAGNEAASLVWLNLTFDPLLLFLSASDPSSVGNGSVRFVLANVPLGVRRVDLQLLVAASAPGGQVLAVSGTADSADGIGNLQARLVLSPASATVVLPRLDLQVTPGSVRVEANAPLPLDLSLSNVGTGVARDVWLNVTLPGGLFFVSDTSDGSRTVIGSDYIWHWTGLGPGTKAFRLSLRASPLVEDGSSSDLSIRAEYTDGGGTSRPPVGRTVRVTFVAPRIQLEVSADRDRVIPGGTVTFTLRARNAGSSPAQTLWLVDGIDPRFEVISYDARVRGEGNESLNWTFSGFQPGQVETITLVLRVREDVAVRSLLANVLEATYTNRVGEVIGYVRSAPVTILVVADLMPLAYILFGGAGLGAVVVAIVYRRNRVQIEEIFLVYRDGILISHLSRTIVQDKDTDTVSGMLTAVQEFVKDAFRYGEHRELHQLEFGDYRILIERGRDVYLAVVYRGRDSGMIRKKVRGVLDRIEETYGGVLATWDGSMEAVLGTRDLLRDHLLGPSRWARWPNRSA